MPSTESATSAAVDPVKHVVYLLLENHSFDQMLGCMRKIYPGLEGVDEAAAPRSNVGLDGKPVFQHATTELQMAFDPKHEQSNVSDQLAGDNGGFVSDFAKTYPKCSAGDLDDVMGYYPLDFLPAMHALARDFTVCDHWFASVPGPTWTNRFFALSGTASGRVTMPSGAEAVNPKWYTEQSQDTLFDRLDEAGRKWKIYYYDFPCSLLFPNQRKAANLANYRKMDGFFVDARGDAAAFPDFVFIEPKYFGVDQNDDHPPHNVMKAEKLIADVYNALRSNPALWNECLLVVLFDEHGGFYDHMVPPAAIAPDDHHEEYGFDRLGVRVPALLVSPWVERGVHSTVHDHTSLLKYLIDKWGLGPLGRRAAAAASIAPAIRSSGVPRTDTIPFIRVSNSKLISPNVDLEENSVNPHHEALHGFADYLHAGMDATMGGGVAAAATAAQLNSGWANTKDAVGQLLAKAGHWLSADKRQLRKAREHRTGQAVERLKESSGN